MTLSAIFSRPRRVPAALPLLLSTFLSTLLYAGACVAQNDDSRLKAAYIFNIAQFTTWPQPAARPM